MTRLRWRCVASAALVLAWAPSPSLAADHRERCREAFSAAARGDHAKVLKLFEKDALKDKDGDKLLYQYELATLAQGEGMIDESITWFGRADETARAYDAAAVISGGALVSGAKAILTGDGSLKFTGGGYERVMSRTLNALNYLMKGDLDGARVEVRKAEEYQTIERQRHEKELAEALAKDEKEKDPNEEAASSEAVTQKFAELETYAAKVRNSFENAFAYYLSSLIYEAGGSSDLNDAWVDIRRAYELAPNAPAVRSAYLDIAQRFDRASYTELSRQLGETAPERHPGDATLVLFHMAGLVPQKEEIKIEMSVGTKLLSLGFPSYVTLDRSLPRLSVETGTTRAETRELLDVQALAARSLLEHRVGMLVRTAARALAQSAIQGQAKKRLGIWGGLAAKAFNRATSGADTRGWYSLPAEVQATRLVLPAGRQRIRVRGGDVNQALDLDLQPGGLHVAVVHSLSPRSEPLFVALRGTPASGVMMADGTAGTTGMAPPTGSHAAGVGTVRTADAAPPMALSPGATGAAPGGRVPPSSGADAAPEAPEPTPAEPALPKLPLTPIDRTPPRHTTEVQPASTPPPTVAPPVEPEPAPVPAAPAVEPEPVHVPAAPVVEPERAHVPAAPVVEPEPAQVPAAPVVEPERAQPVVASADFTNTPAPFAPLPGLPTVGNSAVPAAVKALAITQEPLFDNFLPLGHAHSAREMAIAVVSTSARTDPELIADRDELNVAYVNENGDEGFVPSEQLKRIVLADLMSARDARYSVFRLSIVIDESGSVDDASLERIRSIVMDFLARIPRSYRVQIVRFATTVEIATPFTNDVAVIRQALSGPRLANNGYTALYDAIDVAMEKLAGSGDEALKFCVAFTDGKDNRSGRFGSDKAARPREFLRKVGQITRDRLIPLFLGGVGPEVEHELLLRLADGTLGFYQSVSGPDDLGTLFQTVEKYLAKTYVFLAPVLPGFENPRMIYVVRGQPELRQVVQDIPLVDGRLRGLATGLDDEGTP